MVRFLPGGNVGREVFRFKFISFFIAGEGQFEWVIVQINEQEQKGRLGEQSEGHSPQRPRHFLRTNHLFASHCGLPKDAGLGKLIRLI